MPVGGRSGPASYLARSLAGLDGLAGLDEGAESSALVGPLSVRRVFDRLGARRGDAVPTPRLGT